MSDEIDVKSPKRLRNLKPVAVVMLLVAAAIVTTGIYSRVHSRHELVASTNDNAVPNVAIVEPELTTPTQALVLPGRLDAYTNAPIYARVNGYLHAWYADIGTRVRAGQLLAVIDSPDVDQQLMQARADLKRAQADEKIAETTANRWSKMLAQDSVSAQASDEKTADFQAKQATEAANEANVRRLEALESFKRIVAPFDGIVTARRTDIGQLIDAGSGTGPELFTVSKADQLRVYVSVPQSDAASIRAGLTATLNVPERPGVRFEVTLVNTDQSITPKSGTMLVQLSVDNSSGQLFPGEYAEVHLALPGDAHALIIPASALIFRSDGLQVAVADAQGHAQLREVTIGTDYGTKVEITSGLHHGERVINNPPDSLEQGDPVRVVTSEHDAAVATKVSDAQSHTRESDHG